MRLPCDPDRFRSAVNFNRTFSINAVRTPMTLLVIGMLQGVPDFGHLTAICNQCFAFFQIRTCGSVINYQRDGTFGAVIDKWCQCTTAPIVASFYYFQTDPGFFINHFEWFFGFFYFPAPSEIGSSLRCPVFANQ